MVVLRFGPGSVEVNHRSLFPAARFGTKVDGALVASGNTNKASVAYTGWWRIGYGRVPAGTGYPTTGNFTGSVDDAAIYTTQLSATRVAAHYAAR